MSATGGMAAGGNPSRFRQFAANVSATLATLMRKPRTTDRRRPSWVSDGTLLVGTLFAILAIAFAMTFLDGQLSNAARNLPPIVITSFDEITDFGKSGWFLFPAGAILIVIAAVAMVNMPTFTRLVLATLTVRLGFIFLAIGIPGLFVAILKRLIGRARPFVVDDGGTLVFAPFAWRPDYASIPSGHGTTAFAAAIAIGALWPRARAVIWIYAFVIAISRVVVTAHYPSDIIASVYFGIIGAVLVRDWFAVRRLGFFVDTDGGVHAMPGPSWRRIKSIALRRRGGK